MTVLKSSTFQNLSVVLLILRIPKNFEKYSEPSNFLNCLTKHEIVVEKTIVDGCAQYDVKVKSAIALFKI